MYFKFKSSLCLSVLILFEMIPLLLYPAAPLPETNPDTPTILVDKIATVVNDELITFTDIDKAIQFFPIFRKKEETEDDFYRQVLEDLINYKVVYLEYKNDFVLREEDYAEVQTPVIEKLGSLEELKKLLENFDMDWADFKNFIKEKVVYEKVLKNQLQVKTSIKFDEIEAFYTREYLPLQERLKLKPMSVIEMSTQIEQHLQKVRTQQKLAGWLQELRSSFKIENKLIKE